MNPARVATNIRNKYGANGLARLVAGFAAGTSSRRLAREFGVTKQRVHQWHHALGSRVTTYIVHPDIRAIADERGRS